MTMARVSHPTDRPNFCLVQLGQLTVWFSYETPIAYSADGEHYVRENDWGPTTGKHLRYVDHGNKAKRISGVEFERNLQSAIERLGLA